jgi:hypothetical protein
VNPYTLGRLTGQIIRSTGGKLPPVEMLTSVPGHEPPYYLGLRDGYAAGRLSIKETNALIRERNYRLAHKEDE